MPESQQTKRVLADSLKELMQTKPLSKISVGNITDHCGLNRQTFYYHFRDKYDLVNWIYDTEAVERISRFTDLSHWADGLGDLCLYMQENRKFYINALSFTGQNCFGEYLTQFVREMILMLLEQFAAREGWSPHELDAGEREFLADFYSYAFVGLVYRWARGGMKEDPRGYVERLRRLAERGLPVYFPKKQEKDPRP